MPAATAATIRIFAVGLRPRPTLAPAMLVWVMVAVAESPLAEAVTRICILPRVWLGWIPVAAARPMASVVTVSVWEPLAKVPLGPEVGRKKTTAAPAMGL